MTRNTLSREFYIPEGAAKVADKHSAAVAYVFTNKAGQPCAMAFYGKADKPLWHFRFRSEKEREARIATLFADFREREARKATERQKRKEAGRGLDVGDILKASWGYDQTNIDYYEVTALIGKTMVEIRPLAQERCETLSMQGKCVPLPGQYHGKPSRHVAKDGSIRLTSYSWANKIEPQIVGGVPTYQPDHWTSYA
jgi:hypothetical protein